MGSLALFDLDNTLIAGDSDQSWHSFLYAKGVVSAKLHKHKNEKFYQDYTAGRLDMNAYIGFVAEILNSIAALDVDALREEFVSTVVQPMILPQAIDLVQSHASRGDTTIIISATNYLIVGAIAPLFAVDVCMATRIECIDGVYTGRIIGSPCFQHGKVENMQQWLVNNPEYALDRAHFYSDSINDRALLEAVGHPIVVDPDDALHKLAKDSSWPVISLR